MTGSLLTAANWPIVGQICTLLGKVMNAIYMMLDNILTTDQGLVGLSIIIYTILVYTCMMPLTIKQQRTSKMTSVMNPEIQAIQKKYRNKRDQASMLKQQEEMQQVYDKYGTSMMSGCLPLLIQMPLLFALYPVIYDIQDYIPALEGAPAAVNQFLTIPDLTISPWTMIRHSGDYGLPSAVIIVTAILLPVLSALTQFGSIKLSQAISGTVIDKDNPMAGTMKTMNVTMPLFSLYIVFTLPTGIGIYWIVSAVVRCIQQFFINKHLSKMSVDELIDALKNGKTSGNESAIVKFREKYRNNDVLLIDDIQFIIGKESTQEEFFHTFNHLHTSGKQIIISSDKPPRDIETLEARLRTRFEWGLIADISAPNYETRMAILQKKIELDHLEKYNIPHDVLDYIATNIKTNIRELEGSLNKLIALYKLNSYQDPIDINLATRALKDIISSKNNRVVTPELILDIVADHFNISVADLKSNKRNAEIAIPRQIAMYFIRSMTDTSLKSIGVILGGKDHSTIKYGADKIAIEIKEDETLANTINIIKKKINPA